MKKAGFQFLLFGLILILFSACDKNLVFDNYKAIPQLGWHKDSLVVFSFPITDTLQNHNLYVNIRNDVNYNYSNLWLFIEINQPGNIIATDTFEVLITDGAGKWLGSGFSGIKTQQVPYRSGIFFPVTGEYKIRIQHGMRDETLKSISDIGFRVERAK